MSRGIAKMTYLEIKYHEDYSFRLVEEEERWHGAFIKQTFWGQLYSLFEILNSKNNEFNVFVDKLYYNSIIVHEALAKYLSFNIVYRNYSNTSFDNELFKEYYEISELFNTLLDIEKIIGVPFDLDNGFKRDFIYSLGKLCFNSIIHPEIFKLITLEDRQLLLILDQNSPMIILEQSLKLLSKEDIDELKIEYNKKDETSYVTLRKSAISLYLSMKKKLELKTGNKFYNPDEKFNNIFSTFIYPKVKNLIDFRDFARIVSYEDPTSKVVIHPFYNSGINYYNGVLDNMSFHKLIIIPQQLSGEISYAVFPVSFANKLVVIGKPLNFNLSEFKKNKEKLLGKSIYVLFNDPEIIKKNSIHLSNSKVIILDIYHIKDIQGSNKVYLFENHSNFAKSDTEKIFQLVWNLDGLYYFCCAPGFAINETLPRNEIYPELVSSEDVLNNDLLLYTNIVFKLLYCNKMINIDFLQNLSNYTSYGRSIPI